MLAIALTYGPSVAVEINQAISTYYVKEVMIYGTISTVPVEVTDGLQLLNQHLGPLMFMISFFDKRLKDSKADAT